MLNLRKCIGGAGTESEPRPAPASRLWSPYRQPEVNTRYNMLFCDDAALFAAKEGQPATPWQQELLPENEIPESIRAIAKSKTVESRVRMLAFNWLRQHDQPVSGLVDVSCATIGIGREDVKPAIKRNLDDGAKHLSARGWPPSIWPTPD